MVRIYDMASLWAKDAVVLVGKRALFWVELDSLSTSRMPNYPECQSGGESWRITRLQWMEADLHICVKV